MAKTELEKLKRELAEAKREIQNLKMRLKNAEILYKHEIEQKVSKKAAILKSQQN